MLWIILYLNCCLILTLLCRAIEWRDGMMAFLILDLVGAVAGLAYVSHIL